VIFWRIHNNKIDVAGHTERLGFDKTNPMYIPDDYLLDKEFVIMRTCHGIGDWCLVSSLPRLLKEKYPKSKIYIPSSTMLKNMFGSMLNNWGYGTYDCSKITQDIFRNNPYVDDFIDEYYGEIFHDHYRIYDKSNDCIPLSEQILDFWQFKPEEYLDSTPDIYFSEEEIESGDKLINKYFPSDVKFGYIGLSSTYGETADTTSLRDKIKEYDNLKWFYYGEQPIEETDLNFLQNTVPIKPLNLSLREQMYIRTKAEINIGNETGMTLWCAKYSKTYVLGNKFYGPVHGPNLNGKPRKNPFQTGNFVNEITYL